LESAGPAEFESGARFFRGNREVREIKNAAFWQLRRCSFRWQSPIRQRASPHGLYKRSPLEQKASFKNFAWDISKYRQKGTARRRKPASCPSRARPQLHTAHSLWIEFEFGGGGGVCWRLFADDLAVALVAMALEAAGRASSQWHIAAWTPSAPPSSSE